MAFCLAQQQDGLPAGCVHLQTGCGYVLSWLELPVSRRTPCGLRRKSCRKLKKSFSAMRKKYALEQRSRFSLMRMRLFLERWNHLFPVRMTLFLERWNHSFSVRMTLFLERWNHLFSVRMTLFSERWYHLSSVRMMFSSEKKKTLFSSLRKIFSEIRILLLLIQVCGLSSATVFLRKVFFRQMFFWFWKLTFLYSLFLPYNYAS